MLKKILVCLCVFVLVGCNSSKDDNDVNAVVESIIPSTETEVLIDDNGYEYSVIDGERVYNLYDGHIQVMVPEPLPDNTKLYIYNDSTKDIEDSIIFTFAFQPEGCGREEKGCYAELHNVRLFEGPMVETSVENGVPAGYANDDENIGYQAYNYMNPDDEFSPARYQSELSDESRQLLFKAEEEIYINVIRK